MKKLTPQSVTDIRDKYELRQEVMAEIRQLRADMQALERKAWALERKVRPFTTRSLAKTHGVRLTTINDVVYQKTWRGVL